MQAEEARAYSFISKVGSRLCSRARRVRLSADSRWETDSRCRCGPASDVILLGSVSSIGGPPIGPLVGTPERATSGAIARASKASAINLRCPS
jgi:hypothetical protein